MTHKLLASFFDGIFKDKRLDKRANMVLDSMIKKGKAVVGRCCTTLSQQIGAYRMFNNKNVEIEQISDCIYRHTSAQITCSHILSIQDTSEVNYSSHMGRIGRNDSDIGPVTHDAQAFIVIRYWPWIPEQRPL